MEFVGAVRTVEIQQMAENKGNQIPGFFRHCLKSGGFIYNPPKAASLVNALAPKIHFLPREKVEVNKAWQQIIPYIIITRERSVFTTLRLSGSTEKRLQGKLSLGIGGHINPPDAKNHSNSIWGGMLRELREEVYIALGGVKPIPVGIINHFLDPVGSVHLGIVFRIDLGDPTTAVTVIEKDQLQGEFRNWDELIATNLELWAHMIWEKRRKFAKRFKSIKKT